MHGMSRAGVACDKETHFYRVHKLPAHRKHTRRTTTMPTRALSYTIHGHKCANVVSTCTHAQTSYGMPRMTSKPRGTLCAATSVRTRYILPATGRKESAYEPTHGHVNGRAHTGRQEVCTVRYIWRARQASRSWRTADARGVCWRRHRAGRGGRVVQRVATRTAAEGAEYRPKAQCAKGGGEARLTVKSAHLVRQPPRVGYARGGKRSAYTIL